MTNETNWNTKQIIEVVSKGVNSLLMKEKPPTFKEVESWAVNLTLLYKRLIAKLNAGNYWTKQDFLEEEAKGEQWAKEEETI